MKILFINPSSMPYPELEALLEKTSILRVPTVSMPIGFMDIISYIKAKREGRDEFYLLDLAAEVYKQSMTYATRSAVKVVPFFEQQLGRVPFVPDVIGISLLFSSSYNSCMKVAELCKVLFPNAKVVFGGNHATNDFQNLLSLPSIDFVFRGEAEISFLKFLDNLDSGEAKPLPLGVYGKEKAAASKTGTLEKGNMIDNLDEIPMPAFNYADIDFYRANIGGSLMFSRGCPFLCTFCASHSVHGRPMRYKSVDRCVSEAKAMVDLGFKKFFVEDDLFGAKKKDLQDISAQVEKFIGDVEIDLPQGISVAVMDEDRVQAMLRMGIREAAVAIESGSEFVQKNIIKKNCNLKKAKKLLSYMRSVNFDAHVNFILGYPGESREMMSESIAYMKTLDVNWVYIFHALPLPGSEMFDQFAEVMDIRSIDWDGVRLGKRSFDTKDISAKELEELIYDTNIEVNFFQNSNYRHGRHDLAIHFWEKFITKQYPFHIVGKYCIYRSLKLSGKADEAEDILEDAAQWVTRNKESHRLFVRYGAQMPELALLVRDDVVPDTVAIAYPQSPRMVREIDIPFAN